jgi:hypothetical protein
MTRPGNIFPVSFEGIIQNRGDLGYNGIQPDWR